MTAPFKSNIIKEKKEIILKQYQIIDAHAHIFPTKIAEKAVGAIGDFYDIPMEFNGTSEILIDSGNKIGVEQYLVCSAATRPEQVLSINDFLYEECQTHAKEFIGFASLHPEMEGLEAEMERIIARGFHGIKLHPDFQRFNIDDEKAMEIYRLAEGKLAILFHTGDDRYEFSRPSRLAKVGEKFPGLKCIAAHFGGYQCWDEAYEVYDNPNIYMDTSSTLFTLSPEKANRMIDKFGVSRFFFGTDYPMWSHIDELERVKKLGFSEKELKAVLYDNFVNAILK